MEKSTSSKRNTKSSASKTAKRSNTKTSTKGSMQSEDSMLMDFFTDELKDIYWAEKHLLKVLPKMQKAAETTGPGANRFMVNHPGTLPLLQGKYWRALCFY